MKKVLMLAIPLLLSMPASAQNSKPTASAGTLIEANVSHPLDGPGGWSEVKQTFAQGDKILLHYQSDKKLERVVILQGDRNELAKKRETKSGDLQFVVPKDGEVVIRFINDRNGKNEIKYELRKL